jgi:hypothetical protein
MQSYYDHLSKHGYALLPGKHLADLFPTDHLVFPEDTVKANLPITDTNIVDTMLRALHIQIAMEYIEPFANSFEYVDYDIKANAPISSRFMVPHTDSDEDSDVFFLLYYNDLTPFNEGAFVITDGITTNRIVPKYGELIVVNNWNPKFLHNAEYTDLRRIAASFAYRVDWK